MPVAYCGRWCKKKYLPVINLLWLIPIMAFQYNTVQRKRYDFDKMFAIYRHWEMTMRKGVYSSFVLSCDQHQTSLCVSLGIKATLLERYAGETRKMYSFYLCV